VKKPAMAIKIYERMPASSPLKRNAQIQLATNLDAADRSDEAIKILKGVTAEDPKDIEAIMALGQYRARPQAVRRLCGDLYAGIDAMPSRDEKGSWVTYYYRGICEERAKQWSRRRPICARRSNCSRSSRMCLNYLGYSWIDQGIKSRRRHEDDQARRRSAPRRRLYRGFPRMGLLPHRQLRRRGCEKSRARDRPQAGRPTINDHLGDAYWRIGRTLEAKFQWAHARDLKPEPKNCRRSKPRSKRAT